MIVILSSNYINQFYEMLSNYGQVGTDENVACRQESDQTSDSYGIDTGSSTLR